MLRKVFSAIGIALGDSQSEVQRPERRAYHPRVTTVVSLKSAVAERKASEQSLLVSVALATYAAVQEGDADG